MRKDYITPIFIIVIVAAFAGLLFVSGSDKKSERALSPAPITDIDLVKGDRNADVILYEYSDTECPFCKSFHTMMNRVMSEMPTDNFAWVYRHLPLDSLHKKARPEAVAITCVSKLAGPEKGFEFLDKIMEITPSNDGFDLSLLPNMATELGVNEKDYKECVNSDEANRIVQDNADEAISLGAPGTPYAILYRKSDGKSEVLFNVAGKEDMIEKINSFIKN